MMNALLYFAAILLILYIGVCDCELVCAAENEHYSETVSACPQTCSNLRAPICHAMIVRPSCVCNDGTVNDTVNHRCVAPENCPQTQANQPIIQNAELVCDGKNEVYAESRSACPVKCQNRLVKRNCLSIIMEPSCVCKTGTIRDTVNGKCVAPEDCPV